MTKHELEAREKKRLRVIRLIEKALVDDFDCEDIKVDVKKGRIEAAFLSNYYYDIFTIRVQK